MDAFVIAAWALMTQVAPSNTIIPAPVPAVKSEAVGVKAAIATPRCDARPYQRLVGRTVSDLLTARLPQGSRIYRVDDPQVSTVMSGRLSVELSRSTRVRRVYCS